MASSLISNSHHIDFESVFRLDDASMVQMFETLITTGLKEFLGCPAVFYEDALTEFFANSSVREDGMVVSTIGGTAIEISQEMFAAAFELPTEGLIDLTDVPKNFVFDARSLLSDSKEQDGSFDSVTRDRFLLMTAITFDVKINWSSLLFGVFKEMVTPGSRKAKGYAIQICVLLRNFPGLELGESKSFPVPRILNEKTVHRFVSVNENVGIKEVADAPRARRTPVKMTVSKKRPATGDDEVAPIIKKKRTTKGKPVAVKRLMVEEPDTAISTSGEPVAEDATVFKHQDADRSEKADTWFDEAFDEEFDIANKERQVSEEVIDVTIEEGTGEPSMSWKSVAEELMTIDDLLLQISDDLQLPSITAAEVTMIRLGEFSSIGDKGKAILVEDEQITENPASEFVALICRDVEVLVRLRDSVMKAVVDFFASFSLNTMPDMESLKDLKEKEKLMMEWAETNTLATAVRRQMYVLTNYREMLLRTFLESYRRYLALDQPWTDMAVQVINLLSAAHSQSLEDLKAQQQEHKIEMVQPNSSLPVIDSIDRSGVRLVHFYSIGKSICWVRPMVLIDEVWTPLQGSGYLRSNCKLSLFVDRKRLPESVVAENFDSQTSLIEPARYWGAAPLLIKIWAWQRVCTEAIQFSVSGRLRPASPSSDIVIGNLGVERLPDYFLDDFEEGVNTDYFVEFFRGSSGQPDSEFDSASSSGDTVYRSPSPPDYAYALGPPILSPTVQEERLYFVQSPYSSPAASPQQESSSSSSSDVSLHFDSVDLPVHDHANTQTSAPVDSNVFTNELEDLRSSLSQRIHESTCEIRSKVNDVEFSVRGDLLKQQAWLRQTFQNACEVLERQSTQMNDLKKVLVDPVGTIFQDLFDVKKNQRAQEAKLNALDGQVAAIRNEQLEFQNKISADLLSLSTQFAEIVDYIRGGDAKKGEGGSSSRPPPVRVERHPLPTPQSSRDVAGSSSAVRTPNFPRTTGTSAERAEQARRHILESGQAITLEEATERVRQADIQESDRVQRERDRARREKRKFDFEDEIVSEWGRDVRPVYSKIYFGLGQFGVEPADSRCDWCSHRIGLSVGISCGSETTSFGLVGTTAFWISGGDSALSCDSLQLCERSDVALRSDVGSSDESESGSVGLLLLRRFVSYPFRRLWRSWKRIAKTSRFFSLLAFHPSLLGSEDLRYGCELVYSLGLSMDYLPHLMSGQQQVELSVASGAVYWRRVGSSHVLSTPRGHYLSVDQILLLSCL
ncbi:hypothetical protein F511_11957 [Dorcoceras hygrometricum]|uniref:Dystroglycan-like n=1 Tax=Dorcoceras hygrometricum TaxID=472368 RepID=A0A2Z7DEY0_9LAMI|nr:hypothetical protein F511_11957 [Dorcoceras hygrometricum]